MEHKAGWKAPREQAGKGEEGGVGSGSWRSSRRTAAAETLGRERVEGKDETEKERVCVSGKTG